MNCPNVSFVLEIFAIILLGSSYTLYLGVDGNWIPYITITLGVIFLGLSKITQEVNQNDKPE